MDEQLIEKQDDEISLIDLFAVLWQRKVMIIAITGIAIIGVLIFSILSLKLPPEKSFLPNKYTPQAQMLINDSSSSSGGLSAALSSSGLGSLASLAGVNVSGGSSYSALASYFVGSNSLLDQVIQKFNLIERYEIEKHPIAESRKALKEVLHSSFDEDTGVFTVNFTDIDPVFARDVVNYVVGLLEERFFELGIDKNKLTKKNLEENIQASYDQILSLQTQIHELEMSVTNVYNPSSTPSIMMDTSLIKMELKVQEEIYAQLKAQYEMLKVTMASEQPVFQILEYAEVPDQKSKPSRGMLCIIVTFAAFFVSVFLAFLLNALENIKNDPEAMAKLKKKK
ncbi:MAG: lipopolysaccharide biosynthesis protein [Treponema bryantii]|nr:lipopolysaccharide biosynthesis protein [Treponema bryantii]